MICTNEAMTLANRICQMGVKDGITFLLLQGVTPDEDDVYTWGDFCFFQPYSDSTNLYYEV